MLEFYASQNAKCNKETILEPKQIQEQSDPTRRDFMKTGAVAAAGISMGFSAVARGAADEAMNEAWAKPPRH